MTALKSLLGNSKFCVILASIDILKFRLVFSWFLVWQVISFLLKPGHFLAFIKDSGSYLFNFTRPSLTHPGGKTDVLPHYYQVVGGGGSRESRISIQLMLTPRVGRSSLLPAGQSWEFWLPRRPLLSLWLGGARLLHYLLPHMAPGTQGGVASIHVISGQHESSETLHLASSNATPAGRGRGISLPWVRMKVQALPVDTTGGWKEHYHPAGVRVSAPYLAFSDTASSGVEESQKRKKKK